MSTFSLPSDLVFNTARIEDPAEFARESNVASWLYLNGPEFADMDGGMSFGQVEAAVPHSANVITDPPRVLDMDLAKLHVDALDELPRPTAVTCRAGPRASAVVYMYAGLRQGATPEDVTAAVERDGAPCAAFDDYKGWIVEAMKTLS